jgi:hypothetical protein
MYMNTYPYTDTYTSIHTQSFLTDKMMCERVVYKNTWTWYEPTEPFSLPFASSSRTVFVLQFTREKEQPPTRRRPVLPHVSGGCSARGGLSQINQSASLFLIVRCGKVTQQTTTYLPESCSTHRNGRTLHQRVFLSRKSFTVSLC